jgi:hypothetical protein
MSLMGIYEKQQDQSGMRKYRARRPDMTVEDLRKEIEIYQDREQRIFDIARDADLGLRNKIGKIIVVILESHEQNNKSSHRGHHENDSPYNTSLLALSNSRKSEKNRSQSKKHNRKGNN